MTNMISTEHDDSTLRIEDDNAQHPRIAEAQTPCETPLFHTVIGSSFEHSLSDLVKGALDNREHATEVIGNRTSEQLITGKYQEQSAKEIDDAHHRKVNDNDFALVGPEITPNNPCSQKVNPELELFRLNSNPSIYENQCHGYQAIPTGSKRRNLEFYSSNAKKKPVGKSSQPKENDLKKALINKYLSEEFKRHLPDTTHLMSHIEHNIRCQNNTDCCQDCSNYRRLLRETRGRSCFVRKLLVLKHAVNCRNPPCYMPICGYFSNILKEKVNLQSNGELLVRFTKGSFGSIYLNPKYGKVDKLIKQNKKDQISKILKTSGSLLESKGFGLNNPYLVVPEIIDNYLLRMDYMDASLLEYWQHNNHLFPIEVCTKISYFLARCVHALHVVDLVHCDIKLENFAIRIMAIEGLSAHQIELKDWSEKAYFGTRGFVNGYLEFKLIDLDFVSNANTIHAGSMGYASPAVCDGMRVEKCDDVYSFGITMGSLKKNAGSNLRLDNLINRMTNNVPSRRPSVYDVVQELQQMEMNTLLPPFRVVWPEEFDTEKECNQFFILMMKEINVLRRNYLAEISSDGDSSQT